MKKFLFFASMLLMCIMSACQENELPFDIDQSSDFCDVGFIATNYTGADDKYAEYYYKVGTALSFMDLSANTTSHSWTIDESLSTFLNNEWNDYTTDFSSFVVPGKATTDATAHVLFTTPSEAVPVTLRNTFKYPVFYNGYVSRKSYPSNDPDEIGLHVFDTTFYFNVCDTVGVDYSLYKNDQLLYTHKDRESQHFLADSLSFPVLECMVGDYFTVKIDSLYGPTSTKSWRFTSRVYVDGYSFIVATSDIYTSGTGAELVLTSVPTEPYDTTSFNLGSLDISSNVDPYPSQKKTIVFPYRVRVSQPDATSQLVVRKAAVTNMELDSINVTFNRPLSEYPANLSLLAQDFKVILNNEAAGIVDKVLPVGAMTISNDKRTLTMGVTEDLLYQNDNITIQYLGAVSGYPLKDSYGFEATAATTATTVSYYEPTALSGSGLEFDLTNSNNVYQPLNYWGGSATTWNFFSMYLRTDYNLTSGCLRFNSATPISQEATFSVSVNEDNGFTINCPPNKTYYFEMKYKPVGEVEVSQLQIRTIATSTTFFNFNTFPATGDEGADFNGWYTIKSDPAKFVAGYEDTENKREFRIGLSNSSAAKGLFFLDDVVMYLDCTRPTL